MRPVFTLNFSTVNREWYNGSYIIHKSIGLLKGITITNFSIQWHRLHWVSLIKVTFSISLDTPQSLHENHRHLTLEFSNIVFMNKADWMRREYRLIKSEYSMNRENDSCGWIQGTNAGLSRYIIHAIKLAESISLLNEKTQENRDVYYHPRAHENL